MRLHAWSFICLLSFLLLSFQCVAQERGAITQSGSTLLNAVSKKTSMTVIINTAKVGPAKGLPLSQAENAKEITVIQKLNISVDSHPIFVPRSVFADLVDPREASLRFEKGAFVLSVGGGDGADSYTLHVYFDATKVIRRTLYSTLIPNKAVEETHYWLRILNDE